MYRKRWPTLPLRRDLEGSVVGVAPAPAAGLIIVDSAPRRRPSSVARCLPQPSRIWSAAYIRQPQCYAPHFSDLHVYVPQHKHGRSSLASLDFSASYLYLLSDAYLLPPHPPHLLSATFSRRIAAPRCRTSFPSNATPGPSWPHSGVRHRPKRTARSRLRLAART